MKKYAYYIFLIFIIVGFFSCSLDEEIYSNQNVDDFYKSEEEIELALNGAYSMFWDGYIYKDGSYVQLGDMPTDIMTSTPNKNAWDLFAWTVSDNYFDQLWEASYKMINRCNEVIERTKNSNVTDVYKNSAIGQAEFLRGLCYFNLVKDFGGVPLHITATKSLADVNKTRNTVDEVYAQIILDLKSAYVRLSPFDAAKHSKGYATSGAAKALLAKVYLQKSDWANASITAKEVIDMGVYDLYKDYSQIWDPAYKNGSEQIFSVQHNNGGDNTTNYGEHMTFFLCPKGYSLPDGTGIMFTLDDGNAGSWQVDDNYFQKTPNTYRKWWSVRDRMPRYLITGANPISWIEDTVELQRINIVKYYHPDYATGYLQTGVNFTVLRYSDVYLTYAEALNELNNGPTAEAFAAINKVRQRARAVGTIFEQPESVYPDLAGLDQQSFRNAVLDERAAEFIGEGERRNDLNRHNLFISTAESQGVTGIKPGYVLYPIPQNEINLNPLLEQNPDY
ncbi:SusD family protein [Mariniphaga anaerophila]|uniref:SusD family protein n=1 Tax=Mariniphaga anaerophila TaxID=1484053 RepID=A0A1M5FHZ4_9BACT|nr:RagB/SusD family nutrient uptake outer membrane protein [Mariniphaga anaerophila]SHF90772.1 SusD family protein [Mariniphaga anaerophila]